MIRHLLEWLIGNDWVMALGLTINGINFGTYNPIRKPEMGQQLGDVQVLRKTTHAHAMGGTRSILPVRHWLISPIPVAGNLAGSQLANEEMARWLEEMATNPDIQPMLVQWSNARALPQDGWWFLKTAKPDYQWTGGGAIPVDMEWHFRAPKGAPLYIGYDGGALPGSPATLGATNLIAYPPNSTAIITATRAGGEGSYPYVLSPTQKPVSLQGSSTVADLFKGGCHVYDTMGSFNQVPTIATRTLWHSLGTEAGTDNSIAYWNNIGGSASYASHLITVVNGSALTGGSLDWDDGTFLCRFKFVTNSAPAIFARVPGRGSVGGAVLCWQDANNFHMEVGFADAAPVSTAFVPVNGTFYWMSLQMAGNIATGKIYNDNAGALGSLAGTVTFDASVGHSTALSPRGCVGLADVSGNVVSPQYGGAFANVCTFTGPMLSAWSIGQGTGESAFALSKAQSNSGSYSLSVYNAAAGGQGFFTRTVAHNGTDTYTISAYCRGSGSPTNFGPLYGGNLPNGGLVIADSTWRLSTGTAAYTAGGWPDTVSLPFYGTGTGYFDDISLIDNTTSSMIFAEGCEPNLNSAWLEVFGLEHTFTGNMVVTNGLHLLVFSLSGGLLTAYVWNTSFSAPGWDQAGSMDFLDPVNAVAILQGVRLRKLGSESVHVDCTVTTATPHAGLVTVRLDRGQYSFRLQVRPETFANTNAALLRWTPAQGGSAIVYNSGAIADQVFGSGLLASTTDAQYGAAFIPSLTAQWLYGFLHPKQEAQQPGFSSSVLNLGDTAAPLQRSTATYGFFIVPFGTAGIGVSTFHLKHEAESGALDAGWTSQANASASGGNEAKCASGTVSGRAANALATRVLPAGKYAMWARIKVTSAASGVAQMQFGCFDNTSSAWAPVGVVLAPNQVTTSYAFYLIGTFTANGTDTYQLPGLAKTTATTTTDWFVDEFVLTPITQTALNTGPQEQFQQWLFERTTQYPVA